MSPGSGNFKKRTNVYHWSIFFYHSLTMQAMQNIPVLSLWGAFLCKARRNEPRSNQGLNQIKHITSIVQKRQNMHSLPYIRGHMLWSVCFKIYWWYKFLASLVQIKLITYIVQTRRTDARQMSGDHRSSQWPQSGQLS